jgi:superfamily II DNA or RNA helicase
MLKIKIYNTFAKIDGKLSLDLIGKLDSDLSYNHPGYQFMSGGRGGYGLSGKTGGWDGKVRLFSQSQKFSVGLLNRVKRLLDDNNVKYEVEDNRPILKYGKPLTLDTDRFQVRDYQVAAIKSAKKNGSGIIRVATGGGKTAIIAGIVAQYNIPTVIYVIGIELLYQMKDTIEAAYGVKCGIVGGGVCDINYDITIMTIWSAASAFNKEAKVEETDFSQDKEISLTSDLKSEVRKKVESAQLFIFDECQYAASETLQFIHKASISAKHRFLLSGTPWRDTGDDILIEAVGGEKIYDLSATKLINLGFLIPPEIHFFNVPVVRNVGSTYPQVYTNYIVENEVRNDLIIKSAKKLVAAGKRLLILVVRVGHGKKIMDLLQESGLNAKFLDGGKSTKNRLETIKDMKDGKIDVLVASKIFDQGVDIPELDALILAGSGKSSGRALQRIGRVIRLAEGKDKAIIVDFYDNCKYLKDHSESRIKIYESEPGFKILLPKKDVLHYPERRKVNWT